METKIDLDKPRFDQSTYTGRAKHFFITTNPLNVFKTSKELDKAKDIVVRYKAGEHLPGLTPDDIWRAKHTYDSAFHPDTGEKMFLPGRMSFQVPGNMTITGCMMTFYKSTPAVVFWQWFNQTFNAVVNYTNRSGDSPISVQRLGVSYVLATGGAVSTALLINRQVGRFPALIGRFVPFAAVAVANCINIPCMRSQELDSGIPVLDSEGRRLGDSTAAAKRAIGQVVFSRICMATPGMLIPPILMNRLERSGFLARFPWSGAPIQVLLCGAFLTFATPMCCALFPQMASVRVSALEAPLRDRLLKEGRKPDEVLYYNKGL
ncbi:hypothetical protein BOX15_Mlig000223g3 [Macrostomum lignano]|uniref:Sidoreflexin n=2 Tax=Macrostomum lignano TaxID=282301 RepID=A0A1I8FVD9_9PLAT|nr:hypothetical protein BOX15_Mlig000223g3 [Macrostomum lignano]